MDQKTIQTASAIAAVLCRAIEHHVTVSALINSKESPDTVREVSGNSQDKLAIALENLIDSGALK